MIVSCPYCGSARLAIDDVAGTLVCQDCGSVLDEYLIEDVHDKLTNNYKVIYKNKKPVLNESYRWGNHGQATIMPVSLEYSMYNNIEDGKTLSLAYELRTLLSRSRPPRLLRRKTSIALAVYVRLRARGLSKRKAIEEACRSTHTKRSRLEDLEREYRHYLENLIERVRRECREERLRNT